MTRRATWPLKDGRPVVHIEFPFPDGRWTPRTLLADTGAGTTRSEFELVLGEEDCQLSGAFSCDPIRLRGAYDGLFPVYLVRIRIPGLTDEQDVRAIAVRETPSGLDGIACVRFLSLFTYGNFGDRTAFGLEAP